MFVNLESNFIEYSSSCRLSEKGLLRHLQYLKIGKQARCWMHFAPLSSSMLDEARFDHTNFQSWATFASHKTRLLPDNTFLAKFKKHEQYFLLDKKNFKNSLSNASYILVTKSKEKHTKWWLPRQSDNPWGTWPQSTGWFRPERAICCKTWKWVSSLKKKHQIVQHFGYKQVEMTKKISRLKKDLNSLMVHYFSLDHYNTVTKDINFEHKVLWMEEFFLQKKYIVSEIPGDCVMLAWKTEKLMRA